MYKIETLMNVDLKRISDNELLSQTKYVASAEREITVQLIRMLCEIDQRRAYAKKSVPSLYEYCTKILKLSDSSANRRIMAARLIRQVALTL